MKTPIAPILDCSDSGGYLTQHTKTFKKPCESLDKSAQLPYFYNMITITRNRNFPQWLNIVLNGKLIDNAKNHAQAMSIATRLKKEQPVKTSIVTR